LYKKVTDNEIIERIRIENPWWKTGRIDKVKGAMRHRAYFDLFLPMAFQRQPTRALILMGPRRVGKTVMLHQAVQQLIDSGNDPQSICYVDLQSAIYAGVPLEALLKLARMANGKDDDSEFCMIYDEIQYLRDWEAQLKNSVDTFANVKFIASGSAAAALRLKSAESGAGRFTDFHLPPVTFYEYLILVGVERDSLIYITPHPDAEKVNKQWLIGWYDVQAANQHFINYLNFGGYPESILSKEVQDNPEQFVRSDIIEKVITRDLPSLYGIHDVAELNRLFSALCYNTGQEISLDSLSQDSGVVKQTIKNYIEYLEAAFLIRRLHRIDDNARRFKKANFFKVYLTNPCMRSALFGLVNEASEHIGSLVETAVFAQWFHTDKTIHYARWKDGEVDLVELNPHSFRPVFAVEVKWTDDCISDYTEVKSLRKFLRARPECIPVVTTRTRSGLHTIDGREVTFIPSAMYCYFIGWQIIKNKRDALSQVAIATQSTAR
jgi:uncharacterized protein